MLFSVSARCRTTWSSQDELDELKDTVKAKMVATGEHKVEAGGCIATYQEVTSNRFNSFALKAEDKAAYDKCVIASTAARLTVE